MDQSNRRAKSHRKRGQLPLRLKGGKTEPRTQFAALCYRREGGKVKVCLVTSRRSKRWILPKGWPMHKETPERKHTHNGVIAIHTTPIQQ